jgi:hypothetical protein
MMAHADWLPLEQELAQWTASGRIATLWWRDDDASAATPQLERMLALSADYAAPLGLAVVPARIDPSLPTLLAQAARTIVLQHGYSHANHAPAGEKKAEFGAHRPLSDLISDAGAGWAHLVAMPRVAPIFVPPWNRWTSALAPGLVAVGLRAVSAYGARSRAEVVPGLTTLNTHSDLIDWRGSRGFAGTAPCLALLTAHLTARRLGFADSDEPTGLLTHHLDHDDKCWTFLRDLFSFVSEQRTLTWVSPETLLGPSSDAGDKGWTAP